MAWLRAACSVSSISCGSAHTLPRDFIRVARTASGQQLALLEAREKEVRSGKISSMSTAVS